MNQSNPTAPYLLSDKDTQQSGRRIWISYFPLSLSLKERWEAEELVEISLSHNLVQVIVFWSLFRSHPQCTSCKNRKSHRCSRIAYWTCKRATSSSLLFPSKKVKREVALKIEHGSRALPFVSPSCFSHASIRFSTHKFTKGIAMDTWRSLRRILLTSSSTLHYKRIWRNEIDFRLSKRASCRAMITKEFTVYDDSRLASNYLS